MTISHTLPPSTLADAPALRCKAALFDALAAAGIADVEIVFDGYGDSGQIESILAMDGGNAPVPLPDVSIAYARRFDPDPSSAAMPLGEALEELAFDLLGDTHGGWEDNEGAFGCFRLDVAARRIRLEYHARFVDTCTSEHEF